MIHVTINGEARNIERESMLADMLRSLGVAESAAGVAVAVNDTVVPRGEWTAHRLEDGDVIEIIHAVQGG